VDRSGPAAVDLEVAGEIPGPVGATPSGARLKRSAAGPRPADQRSRSAAMAWWPFGVTRHEPVMPGVILGERVGHDNAADERPVGVVLVVDRKAELPLAAASGGRRSIARSRRAPGPELRPRAVSSPCPRSRRQLRRFHGGLVRCDDQFELAPGRLDGTAQPGSTVDHLATSISGSHRARTPGRSTASRPCRDDVGGRGESSGRRPGMSSVTAGNGGPRRAGRRTRPR